MGGMSVCVALAGLHHRDRIYLHWVSQLCVLVRVLEESAGEKQEGGGYGGWAQHWETQKLFDASLIIYDFLTESLIRRTPMVNRIRKAIAVICPTQLRPIFQSTLSSLRKFSFSVDALTPRLDNSSNLSFPQLRSRTPKI